MGRAAEGPAPVIFQSGAGRFEVAALDGAAAQKVSAEAAEAWEMLSGPLGLPDRFSPPIFVRLVPASEWSDIAAFRVVVEPGGVVSLRLRWTERVAESVVRRALVQALLMRLGVARLGVVEHLTVPLWLEIGCVGWWRTRAAPARFDEWRLVAGGIAPPTIAELLAWRRGEAETPAREQGALGLLMFLQMESGREGAFAGLLMKLLAGDDTERALATAFAGRYSSNAERELWWQTGWHHLRRINPLPTLSAADSRGLVRDAARFVFARDDGRDFVLPLDGVLARGTEPLIEIELARRAAELNRVVATLHPFYQNAGLSLVAAFTPKKSTTAKRTEIARAFEQDLRDGEELEAATTAALDAFEKR